MTKNRPTAAANRLHVQIFQIRQLTLSMRTMGIARLGDHPPAGVDPPD
eukprot:CAMPEP_0196825986 /NCGR_PEP_ID=MMETSP1362-20130617/93379_1 /TAXON_ID=163516 /ORGANISM="Leptocylindrus danicus, Strain CCMP1856" /LENGTH=47 /DNA_ID= /DNA_START= /DNA_END= /DNA_ORIENTATION=